MIVQACNAGSVKVVDALLEHGVDPNLANKVSLPFPFCVYFFLYLSHGC